MRPLGSFIRIPGNRDLFHCGWAHWLQVDWVVPIKFVHGDVTLDLILSHLRVVDANLGLVSKKTLADINGGSFPCVSPVSFLNAKPSTAIFFPETVLNMEDTTRFTNLLLW
jgi:hypothetical protein